MPLEAPDDEEAVVVDVIPDPCLSSIGTVERWFVVDGLLMKLKPLPCGCKCWVLFAPSPRTCIISVASAVLRVIATLASNSSSVSADQPVEELEEEEMLWCAR